MTAPISRNPNRILADVIDEMADRFCNAPALLSEHECLTYRELVERTNRYARWAIAQGISKGDVVGLLMTNQPDYFAIWLGVARMGGVVALLNTNLVGASLSHCIDVARPKCLIVSAALAYALETAAAGLSTVPTIWFHGGNQVGRPQVDVEISRYSGENLTHGERPAIHIEDRALHIFTSGTTGLPKAANVSHARILQWSHWFAGMTEIEPADRMYSCLPMYHSIGGVLAPGAALVGGGSIVIREKFSASQFWNDVVRWDCTMFQYIGEFCRYLLHASPSPNDRNHRIRIACGNGLALDLWDSFQERFHIPRILEFYASTEGGVSLFNVEGKQGAIGRIPPYLAHRFAPALVRIDTDTAEPLRNTEGFCVRCAPNEPGEALGRGVVDLSNLGTRFEGYTDESASEKKILRHVFEQGDVWIRTGDLMRKDEKGFYYFVDRLGDTFRWKGENVATSEVAQAICTFPGVKHASVYGVAIPSTEGRAGMAALVVDGQIDLCAFRQHLIARLPWYARPLFLRFQKEIASTGTFKYSKTDLAREGYDVSTGPDAIYFDDPESGRFLRLDKALYDRIQGREIKL